MRALILSIAVAASVFIFCGDVFAKTAGCPCSPCKCSPCSCGGGSGGKGDKHHHHNKDHGDVGVGVNVDLGGVGQRKTEADPFAVGGGAPVSHTEEKPKTRKESTTKPDVFSNVELTGREAKGDSNPPGPINISDDTESPPPIAFAGAKETVFTMDDLKKAQDAYKKAREKVLRANPNWQKLLSATGSNNPKTSEDAFKKINKLSDKFLHSDEGQKLFDDWMKAYQSVNKTGVQIADDLVPPDKLEEAKHYLANAQHKLDDERDLYNVWKNGAVSENAGVKNIQTEIDKLKTKTHFSDKDAQADRDKVKQLQADLDNARKNIEKDFAATDAAKDQMKKVQQAEKDLDKAKADFKPYEGLEKNPAKAASNP